MLGQRASLSFVFVKSQGWDWVFFQSLMIFNTCRVHSKPRSSAEKVANVQRWYQISYKPFWWNLQDDDVVPSDTKKVFWCCVVVTVCCVLVSPFFYISKFGKKCSIFVASLRVLWIAEFLLSQTSENCSESAYLSQSSENCSESAYLYNTN